MSKYVIVRDNYPKLKGGFSVRKDRIKVNEVQLDGCILVCKNKNIGTVIVAQFADYAKEGEDMDSLVNWLIQQNAENKVEYV